MAFFEGNNMTGGYGNGPDIINSCSVNVERGEIVSILGPNGAGKSTAMKAMLGLLNLKSGSVIINGKDISKLSPQDRVKEGISFVPQTKNVFAGMTVEENLEMGAFLINTEFKETINEIFDLFPILKEKKNQLVGELSGGQRQRVSIARTLIMKPKFVVCDEPTSMLDVSIRISIMDLMLNLAKDLEVSYLYITHDLAVARYMCNRIAVMFNGKIVEIAETEELLNNPVHPYTKRLISSIPVPDPTYDRKVYDINFDELDSLIEKHGSDSPMIDIGNQHYVATHDVKGLI